MNSYIEFLARIVCGCGTSVDVDPFPEWETGIGVHITYEIPSGWKEIGPKAVIRDRRYKQNRILSYNVLCPKCKDVFEILNE